MPSISNNSLNNQQIPNLEINKIAEDEVSFSYNDNNQVPESGLIKGNNTIIFRTLSIELDTENSRVIVSKYRSLRDIRNNTYVNVVRIPLNDIPCHD